ncbi:MAG: ABC transporter permease, partial [Granulicatella sp.]
MIVYKYFLKLAYRLKSYAIIFLVIFMGMGLSQVLGNQEVTGFQDTKYKVVIKDESEGNSDIINAMIASLKKDHKVTLTTNSDNSMKEAVYANDADGAMWIPSDVDARINKGEEALNMEIGNSLEGNLLREYVNSYIRYAVVLKNQGNFSAENMDKILKEQATVSVISKDATVKDADYYAKFGEIYFSYTPFVYISVFIFLLGLIFALLEKDEVAKRIIIGMKSVNRVTFEKFLGGLTVVGIIVGINLAFV